MSIQRRNGQQQPLTIVRALSECRRLSGRSRGEMGPRARWLASLMDSGSVANGRLTRPTKDPEGRWYTPEMDEEALRLDRECGYRVRDVD